MTAIVYDPSSELLVADRRVISGTRYDDDYTKMWVGKDFVMAGSGDLGGIIRYIAKYRTDDTHRLCIRREELISDFENMDAAAARIESHNCAFSLIVMYFDKNLDIKAMTWSSPGVYFPQSLQKPVGLGSGGDFCVGAVMAGSSATEAIALCSQVDPAVSGDVDVCNVRETLMALFEQL